MFWNSNHVISWAVYSLYWMTNLELHLVDEWNWPLEGQKLNEHQSESASWAKQSCYPMTHHNYHTILLQGKIHQFEKILFIKNSPFISPWVISMTHSYLCRWGQENIQYRCSRYSVQGYLHLFDWRADPRIEGGDLSCFRKMTWLCHLVLNTINGQPTQNLSKDKP